MNNQPTPKTPLSDRIRPNSEAAPWVIEEVKQLERERDAMRDKLEDKTIMHLPLVQKLDAVERQNQEMRLAIQEAHAAIKEARECVYDEVLNWRAVDINLPKSQTAIAKLQPFLQAKP